MSYLVLARKYRPQTFDDLVGQEHATTTLKNALKAKRLAHAYVFSGPRGCGKTTTARLLAKALNCVNGPTPDPCGQCPQCVQIAAGSSTDDVLEIDGASNRGIDQIRELRDTVKYAPSRSRYRIYIIDEAHQITDHGFNALLKTLEEPPAHAVFMMATTETHKIPATILSRCQRFQMRPIALSDIHQRLAHIVKAEGLKADDEALREIARAGNGSLRDALSLMDQAAAFAAEGVTAQHVRDLLGLLPRDFVRSFTDTLRAGKTEEALRSVQRAVDDGIDLFQLGHDLRDFWHETLLWKTGVRPEGLPHAADLSALAEVWSFDELERALALISSAIDAMRRSEAPRLSFELACLDVARRAVPVEELIDRLAALEKSLGAGSPTEARAPQKKNFEPPSVLNAERPNPPEPKRPPAADPQPGPDAPRIHRAMPEPAGSAAVLTEEKPPMTGENPPQENVSWNEAWRRTLADVAAKKPSLESFLSSAKLVAVDVNAAELYFEGEFQRAHIQKNIAFVIESMSRFLGRSPALRCVLGRVDAPALPPADIEEPPLLETAPLPEEPPLDGEEAETAAEASAPATQQAVPVADDEPVDPAVKKFMSVFPGKLKRIQEPA